MKKLIMTILLAGLLLAVSGCANCRLCNWFRGAPCNPCNPPLAKPPVNFAPNCADGNCGVSGACTTGTCATGQCPDGNCSNVTLGTPQIGPALNPPVPGQNVQPPVFGTPNGVPYYTDPNLNSSRSMQPPNPGRTSYQYGNPPSDESTFTGSSDNSILPPNFGSPR